MSGGLLENLTHPSDCFVKFSSFFVEMNEKMYYLGVAIVVRSAVVIRVAAVVVARIPITVRIAAAV